MNYDTDGFGTEWDGTGLNQIHPSNTLTKILINGNI